jgi:hypothetical protein
MVYGQKISNGSFIYIKLRFHEEILEKFNFKRLKERIVSKPGNNRILDSPNPVSCHPSQHLNSNRMNKEEEKLFKWKQQFKLVS